MSIEDIVKGDVLVNVDKNGCGYYKVLKVNRVTVDVMSETGAEVRAYPIIFDRKSPNVRMDDSGRIL